MTDRVRFHLDENVDPDVARGLRRYGIDATTTVDADLRSQSDEVQLAFAARTGRILVTHDADFLALVARDTSHPGIAFCNKSARSVGEMIRGLILIYEVLTPEQLTGRIEYI